MSVFLDNSSDGIDIGCSHDCLQRTTTWFELGRPSYIYKGFMPSPNRPNHAMFLSQMHPLLTWLFHSAFSLSTHKIYSRSVVLQTHPFFPNVQWYIIWQYTNVLLRTLVFFFFLHIDCCTICSYILLHFIGWENSFSLSPHAKSFVIGVSQHAFR